MIDTVLLAAIAGLLAAQLWQRHRQHRELITWLDSLGNMTGDMLRGLLDAARESKGGD